MTKTPREKFDELKDGIKILTQEQKDLLLCTTMYVFAELAASSENTEFLKKSCIGILNEEETKILGDLNNLFKG